MLIMMKLDNDWFGVVNLSENTISDEMIRDEIYRRFLEPTKKDKKEYIGIEIEIPIINLNKEAVDFDVVHRDRKSVV